MTREGKWLLTSLLLSTPLLAQEVIQPPVESGIVAPSHIIIRDGYNMFLQAELLYWIAQEDGLSYAQSGYGAATDFNGALRKLQPHWDPGVRVSLGGNMPYDGWDILMSWTYYSTRARQSSVSSLAVWAYPDSLPATVSSIGANWHFNMNLFDVEMGRPCWVGEHLSLRPFFGARGAWFNQSLTTTPTYTNGTSGYTKARSDFEAGGIRAGVEALYELYHGWSIYGLASGGVLYASFSCPFREKHSGTVIAFSGDNFHAGIGMAQFTGGLQWGTHFGKGRYYFTGKISWEQNMWFGANQMQHWQGTLQSGILDQSGKTLSLQGGALSARLDF